MEGLRFQVSGFGCQEREKEMVRPETRTLKPETLLMGIFFLASVNSIV